MEFEKVVVVVRCCCSRPVMVVPEGIVEVGLGWMDWIFNKICKVVVVYCDSSYNQSLSRGYKISVRVNFRIISFHF